MKKLGKKINSSQATIEAYCSTCSYCGCVKESCPSICAPWTSDWATVIQYSANPPTNTYTVTFYGQTARQG